jgi:hypothetical protein
MEKREPIKASEGHILTNGTIYGRIIYLADGLSADGFREITEAEYEDIIAAEEDEDIDNPDRATEEDYQQALRDMGVSV